MSWNATQTVVLLLPNAVTEPELDVSMAAWDGFQCNGPDVVKLADGGGDPDLVDGLALGNPALIGTPFADITHAGWLPATFFNAIAPNGASFIPGVTFTFTFIDGGGNPTDIDGNRRADVAFREIYLPSVEMKRTSLRRSFLSCLGWRSVYWRNWTESSIHILTGTPPLLAGRKLARRAASIAASSKPNPAFCVGGFTWVTSPFSSTRMGTTTVA